MKRKPWADRYAAHIKSAYWAELKRKVIKRRGKKCERCCKEGGPLDLHHLHYRTFGRERQKDVQLLCRPCHEVEDKSRKERGDARRVRALLDQNDQWWSGDFTDAQVNVMVRGGVLSLPEIAHVIDCWDDDDDPAKRSDFVSEGMKLRAEQRSDAFRASVREHYEKHCGPRKAAREREDSRWRERCNRGRLGAAVGG